MFSLHYTGMFSVCQRTNTLVKLIRVAIQLMHVVQVQLHWMSL